MIELGFEVDIALPKGNALRGLVTVEGIFMQLVRVLQRIEHLRRILYLIKDQKRLVRQDLLSASHRQIWHDAVHILRRPEELPVFRILIKVEIRRILIVAPPQFREQPRLRRISALNL